jgi:hypothetical protein
MANGGVREPPYARDPIARKAMAVGSYVYADRIQHSRITASGNTTYHQSPVTRHDAHEVSSPSLLVDVDCEEDSQAYRRVSLCVCSCDNFHASRIRISDQISSVPT